MKKTSVLGSHPAGFTLIETVFVILMTGILFAMFSDALLSLKKDSELSITEQRLEKVTDALKRYSAYNGSLPCPANRLIASTAASATETDANANYGVAHADCPAAAVRSGTVSVGGVRIGMLPVKSLNLPTEFAIDGWQTRFIYAVSESMTTPGQYNFGAGSVAITGHTNNVAFIVVSVGADREGGFRTNAHTGTTPDLSCTNMAGADSENCDDDATFSFLGYSGAAGVNFFDDYVAFRNLPVPVDRGFPPGAIMPFRLTACPKDWTEYVAARGRSIIGATPSGWPAYSNPAPSSTALSGYSGQNFSLGGTGGNASRMDDGAGGTEYFSMPPYVEVIYCEKD